MGTMKLSSIGGIICSNIQYPSAARIGWRTKYNNKGKAQIRMAPAIIPRRSIADQAAGSGASRYKTYSPHPLSRNRLVNSVAATTNALECWFVLGCACQVIQPKKM